MIIDNDYREGSNERAKPDLHHVRAGFAHKFYTPPMILALLALCLLPAVPSRAADLDRSVVKFYTVIRKPNWRQPWDSGYQYNSGGSGCVLDGRRILTNAHVVSDAMYIQVKRPADPKKYSAHVEFVGHDTELAVVRVDDPKFFEGTKPADLGELPTQRDKLAVYGFPVGGDELSITEGIASRIDVRTYTHSQRDLLVLQTDAAINPGNSGGPVFKGDKLVGVAFQSQAAAVAQNMGYAVPVPMIRRFLKDAADGTYHGVPELGVRWQTMESDALRRHAGMSASDAGVLVTRVTYGSPAWGALREGDVIASVAGVPVANDGTIVLRKEERVQFSYAVSQLQMGERLPLRVLRDGKPVELALPLKPFQQLVPGPQHDVMPRYFVFGGFVFVTLSFDFLEAGGWERAEPRLRALYAEELPSEGRREIVLVSQVLPDDINVGYHKLRDALVRKVNGSEIGSLEDVVAAFDKPAGGYHVVEVDHAAHGRTLDYWSDAASRIVFLADGAAQANRDVLVRYRIAADRWLGRQATEGEPAKRSP